MSEISKFTSFLGLGKTLFNSSICHLTIDAQSDCQIEIVLTERLTRKKVSGHWPAEALKFLKEKLDFENLKIVENRDVITPLEYEEGLNSVFPFYTSMEQQQLHQFLSHSNSKIEFIPHHFCHALSSLYLSPFEKSIVLVMDGAGSKFNSFQGFSKEAFVGFKSDKVLLKSHFDNKSNEECSIYLQDQGKLTCIYKNWQLFTQDPESKHYFSQGLGTTYEKVAEYIFNNKQAAGNVMGLAAFNHDQSSEEYQGKDNLQFLKELDWGKSFQGSSKQEWEESEHLELYKKLAAEIQRRFEQRYLILINELQSRYPDYKNVTLAGGCALNCTNNMKLLKTTHLEKIFVSPFPGDEGISLGCAYYHYWNGQNEKALWKPAKPEKQISYYGALSSLPSEAKINDIFKNYQVLKSDNICDLVSEKLLAGEVIAWYQGRSECGPRALGNRSILCRIDKDNAKQYLNDHVKFRESFRPYGSSCLWEYSHQYFDLPKDFENPFMSFACDVKPEFKNLFKEVSHIDGTSRMQTVRQEQNPLFHQLLTSYGDKSGTYCLLNTSLNVMGEPIVETLSDAKNFLDQSKVHGLAVGSYFILKK